MTESEATQTGDLPAEIFETTAPLALRGAWSLPRSDDGGSYRVAKRGAVIALTRPSDSIYVLTLDLEPDAANARSIVAINSANNLALATMSVRGRQSMRVVVPGGRPGVDQLHLTIDPIEGDPRIRVHRIAARELSVGVGSARSGMVLGDRGWYALEAFGGEIFRWVDNDAEIRLLPTFRASRVGIDVEPGPGIVGGLMKLFVYDDDDRPLALAELKGRDIVEVPVDPKATHKLRLHVANGGHHKTDDPRVLNMRVFNVTALD